jgi:hypothetical protein
MTAEQESIYGTWTRAGTSAAVPGVLRCGGADHLKVELHGGLADFRERFEPAKRLFNLLGTNGDGDKFTVEGAMLNNSNFTIGAGARARESWRGLRAYKGIHYNDQKRVKIRKVEFFVEGLADWWGLQPIVVTQVGRVSNFSLPTPRTISINLAPGCKLVLREDANSRFSQKAANLRMDAHGEISFSGGVSIREAEHMAELIRFFLCLANNSKLEFIGQKMETSKGMLIERYFANPGSKDLEIPRRKRNIGLDGIESRRHKIFKNWVIMNNRCAPAIEFLVGDVYGKNGGVATQLLSFSNALEGYHRRVPGIFKKNPDTNARWTLLERYLWMWARSARLFPSGVDGVDLCGKLRDVRNYYSHFYLPKNKLKPALASQKMGEQIEFARALLYDQILLDLGVPLMLRKEVANSSFGRKSLLLDGHEELQSH